MIRSACLAAGLLLFSTSALAMPWGYPVYGYPSYWGYPPYQYYYGYQQQPYGAYHYQYYYYRSPYGKPMPYQPYGWHRQPMMQPPTQGQMINPYAQPHQPITEREQPAATSGNVVQIQNMEFQPVVLTVKVGTTVRWEQLDMSMPHVIKTSSAPMAFESPLLNVGQHYTFTFTEAGTYDYFCTLHPHMMGKIVVEPA